MDFSSELTDPRLYAKSFYIHCVVVEEISHLVSKPNVQSSQPSILHYYQILGLLIFTHATPRLVFHLIAFDIVNLGENEEDKICVIDTKERLVAMVVCYFNQHIMVCCDLTTVRSHSKAYHYSDKCLLLR